MSFTMLVSFVCTAKKCDYANWNLWRNQSHDVERFRAPDAAKKEIKMAGWVSVFLFLILYSLSTGWIVGNA